MLSQEQGEKAGRSFLPRAGFIFRAACFLQIQLLLAETLKTQAKGPGYRQSVQVCWLSAQVLRTVWAASLNTGSHVDPEVWLRQALAGLDFLRGSTVLKHRTNKASGKK